MTRQEKSLLPYYGITLSVFVILGIIYNQADLDLISWHSSRTNTVNWTALGLEEEVVAPKMGCDHALDDWTKGQGFAKSRLVQEMGEEDLDTGVSTGFDWVTTRTIFAL